MSCLHHSGAVPVCILHTMAKLCWFIDFFHWVMFLVKEQSASLVSVKRVEDEKKCISFHARRYTITEALTWESGHVAIKNWLRVHIHIYLFIIFLPHPLTTNTANSWRLTIKHSESISQFHYHPSLFSLNSYYSVVLNTRTNEDKAESVQIYSRIAQFEPGLSGF